MPSPRRHRRASLMPQGTSKAPWMQAPSQTSDSMFEDLSGFQLRPSVLQVGAKHPLGDVSTDPRAAKDVLDVPDIFHVIKRLSTQVLTVDTANTKALELLEYYERRRKARTAQLTRVMEVVQTLSVRSSMDSSINRGLLADIREQLHANRGAGD